MRRLIKTVLVLTLVSGPTAQALAKGSLHIERQCSRYGNFCGTTTNTPAVIYTKPVTPKIKAKAYKPKTKKVKIPIAVHNGRMETRPFIDRQCNRYGHFC